jgi:hypothetical protein
MRVALARTLDGIDSVELGDLRDPQPAAGQALVRVHGAGVGLWNVGFLGGGFPGVARRPVTYGQCHVGGRNNAHHAPRQATRLRTRRGIHMVQAPGQGTHFQFEPNDTGVACRRLRPPRRKDVHGELRAAVCRTRRRIAL